MESLPICGLKWTGEVKGRNGRCYFSYKNAKRIPEIKKMLVKHAGASKEKGMESSLRYDVFNGQKPAKTMPS